jgi:septal ring factor EnvC (AmiA/AmiB activator)
MSLKQTQELKGMQVRLQKAKLSLSSIEGERKELQSKWDKQRSMVATLEANIKLLTSTGIVVSEHAIIRFMERAMGLDLEQVKAKILGDNSELAALPNGKYPICEGLRCVVRNGVVVSVV